MHRQELENYTQQLLECPRFRDYCPNGLQVEGRPEIRKIVTGVTANQLLLEQAVQAGADAILVHHGFFWKNEDSRIVGIKRRRLGFLFEHELNLFAWHLPLDAHPTLGNNAQLAQKLGWQIENAFGEQGIALIGRLPTSQPVEEMGARLQQLTGRTPLLIPGDGRPIHRIGWCSGGAQGYFDQALAHQVDAFMSGEISESVVHTARESGVAFIAAGHHATERYGIQALGAHLAAQFGLAHQFIDIDSPA